MKMPPCWEFIPICGTPIGSGMPPEFVALELWACNTGPENPLAAPGKGVMELEAAPLCDPEADSEAPALRHVWMC